MGRASNLVCNSLRGRQGETQIGSSDRNKNREAPVNDGNTPCHHVNLIVWIGLNALPLPLIHYVHLLLALCPAECFSIVLPNFQTLCNVLMHALIKCRENARYDLQKLISDLHNESHALRLHINMWWVISENKAHYWMFGWTVVGDLILQCVMRAEWNKSSQNLIEWGTPEGGEQRKMPDMF